MAVVAVAWVAIGVAAPNQLAEAQASIVYYADGKTEMDRITEVDGNRESVPLSKVPGPRAARRARRRGPQLLPEQRRLAPPASAAPSSRRSRAAPTQGGSTITQQYVKNYFLTQDQTLTRKAKEIIISAQDRPAEVQVRDPRADYLNTIYYGRGAYGIQTAPRRTSARTSPSSPSARAPLLASVIRGPGYYDPSLGAQQKKNAQARVDYVLDGMVSEGWLTPAQRAKATFPKVLSAKATSTSGPGRSATSPRTCSRSCAPSSS